MGISDWFYPDNPKRERRAKELAMDCANLVNSAKKDYDDLQQSINHLNNNVVKMFQEIGQKPPKLETIQLKVNKHMININLQHNSMLGVFNLQPALYALRTSSASHLLSKGLISGSSFNGLVGLPSYLIINSGLQLINFVIDDIIGIFTGEKRGRLQRVIREAGKSRANLKRTQLINSEILLYVSSLKKALDALMSVGYSKDKINEIFYTMTKQKIKQIQSVNHHQAINLLRNLDHSRGSWTKEG